MYIYLYIYICICIFIQIYVYVFICIYMYIYIYIYIHVYSYMYIHKCWHIHIYIYMYMLGCRPLVCAPSQESESNNRSATTPRETTVYFLNINVKSSFPDRGRKNDVVSCHLGKGVQACTRFTRFTNMLAYTCIYLQVYVCTYIYICRYLCIVFIIEHDKWCVIVFASKY